MDESDRRDERKERKERKRAAKEERKRRRAQAHDDYAAHKSHSDEHNGSDSDDAAAGQQIAKATNDEADKPTLYLDSMQKHWWDENNRVRCAVYNTHRPDNFPAKFTTEVNEFVYVQVPSTYVGMQRYEPGKIVKSVAEGIYEVVIRDGIRVFASKEQLRRRIVYNNLVEAYDDFPFEILAEAEAVTEERAEANEEMAVDTPPQPSFWLVTVYRKHVIVNDGTSDDWFDLSHEEEWTRLEEYATLLRYKRSSTQGIRVLDCHLDEDNIRRLVKSLLYFNISTIEFPWIPYFLKQSCNEPFKMLVKANEMTLQSVRNVPCLIDVPQQLLKEASQMSERLCYGDETLFSVTNQFSDALNLTITNERINVELGVDALSEDLRKRVRHLRIKSAIRLCENNTERIIRGLSDVEPHLPNVNEVEVEMEHIISEEDYCFDTDKFSDVEALCQRVIEEMAKVVNLVDTEFIWLPTVKKWNFTINFHLRTYSDYFDDEENNRDFLEMISAKIMVVSWYFEKEENAGPGTVKASFDVSSNKMLTAVFELKHMTEFEPATCDREDYEGYVKFHEDFSA